MPGDFSLTDLLGVDPGILDTLKAAPAGVWNVDCDQMDRAAFEDLADASREFERLIEGGKETTFPALLQDVFDVFYKAAPEMVPEDRVDAAHRAFNRPMAEKLMQDPATAEARLTTVLDELSAGLAALSAGKKLLEEIKNREDLNRGMNLAGMAQAAQENGDEETAEGFAQQAQQALDGAARAVRQAVRSAAQAGAQEAQETAETLAGWGLSPGDLRTVPLGDRLTLVERLRTPNMRRLADMVGRFRNLARARQKQKVRLQRDEAHSITQGADLARVLPAELAALRHPLRRLDFYRRLTERQVLQYDLQAREPQGRGPIIALVDVSGSMNGQPLDWAVSTALALLDTATRQKRRFAVAFFDTEIKREVQFEPGERNAQKILDVATMGVAGGTDYVPALTRAMELIQDARYSRADVVMISDGACQLPDDFRASLLAAKEQLEFRVWSVLIGRDPYGELARWSDQVWEVARLTEDVAGEIFAGVV